VTRPGRLRGRGVPARWALCRKRGRGARPTRAGLRPRRRWRHADLALLSLAGMHVAPVSAGWNARRRPLPPQPDASQSCRLVSPRPPHCPRGAGWPPPTRPLPRWSGPKADRCTGCLTAQAACR